MTTSDLDLVRLCEAIYAPQPAGFDHVESVAGIVFGVKHTATEDIVVPRGSQTVADWWRDIKSEFGSYLPAYPQLGFVPHGFAEGIAEAYHTIATMFRPGQLLVFAGHSLGCAHAALLAGIHALLVRPPGRMMLAAPPRSGTDVLSHLLSDWRVDQYRNTGDPVPSFPVPDAFGLLPWQHLAPPFTVLHESGDPSDLSALRCHHAALYEAGIAKLRQDR